MDGDSLYETDILAWSEAQAAALRALAGRRDLPNALDLHNVIEEIESVGRSQLDAVESRLRLILEHLLKLAVLPHAVDAPHWQREIANWHADILQRFAPSMRQRLDLETAWRRGSRIAVRALAAQGAALPALPEACPFALDAFLAEELDTAALVARLTPP